MSERITYLFIALLLLWGGVAYYLWRLASLRSRLEERVRMLESPALPRQGKER